MFMVFKNPGLEFSTQSLLFNGNTNEKGNEDFAALLTGMIGDNESVSLMVPVSSDTSEPSETSLRHDQSQQWRPNAKNGRRDAQKLMFFIMFGVYSNSIIASV